MTQKVNSQGKQPAQSFLDEKSRELAYVQEMKFLLAEPQVYSGFPMAPFWTEEKAARQREIWEKYHGPIKAGKR